MRLGTKSVLFGAHAFWLHPWFVAAAWWMLYGFPWDPRLWVAFIVHDLGYLGKPNMDGPEGERHPEWGALLMDNLFGFWDGETARERRDHGVSITWRDGRGRARRRYLGRWGRFALLHSRYVAKHMGVQPSRLCMADKLAIALTPAWLYLPLVRATGEIAEYRKDATQNHPDMPLDNTSDEKWYADVQDYCRRWAYEHRDGREDTWTSARREVRTDSGVWT